MKVHFQHPNIILDEMTRRVMERRIDALQKRIKRYRPESSHFTIRLQKNSKGELFRVHLELKVLQKILTVAKEGHDLLAVFEDAFQALIKQFEKFRFGLNKSLRAKRQARESAAEVQATIRTPEWRQLVEETVVQKMESLLRLARHELLNFQLNGQLEPGEILPQDIVDEAVVRAYEKFDQSSNGVDIQNQLVRQVIAVSREMAETVAQRRRQTISIERPLREWDDDEVAVTLGEEMLYFYEPDEVLKWEDVFENPTAVTPDEVLESGELQEFFYKALTKLPDESRTVFTLLTIEGFTPEEVGMILDRTKQQVLELLRQAEERLQTTLRKSKVTLELAQMRMVYQAIKSLPVGLENRGQEELNA